MTQSSNASMKMPCSRNGEEPKSQKALEAAAHLAQSHHAGVTAIHRQWHETRLGIGMALAKGGGDLRDDSDWLRAGPFAALRPRIKCHGPRLSASCLSSSSSVCSQTRLYSRRGSAFFIGDGARDEPMRSFISGVSFPYAYHYRATGPCISDQVQPGSLDRDPS
jgi:hypothetical protein